MTKIHCLIFLFLICNLLSSQKWNGQIPDSLKIYTYDQLELKFINSIEDSLKSEIYASTILNLGIENRDTLNILNGYNFLAFINETKPSYLRYNDSLVDIASKVNNNRFKALGYLNKADYYFEKKQFGNNYYLVSSETGLQNGLGFLNIF